MKKIFFLSIAACFADRALADSLTDGIDTAGDAIYSYTPYVQALGYILACLIGIIGAFAVYYAYINEAHNIKKRLLRWGGGCVAMLCMTIALPSFFDYQESGLLADGSTSGTSSGNYAGGDNWGIINSNIPGMNSGLWSPDERFIDSSNKPSGPPPSPSKPVGPPPSTSN